MAQLDPLAVSPEVSESGSFTLGDLDDIGGGIDLAQLDESGQDPDSDEDPAFELDPPPDAVAEADADADVWELEIESPQPADDDGPEVSEIELDPLSDLEILEPEAPEPVSLEPDHIEPIDPPAQPEEPAVDDSSPDSITVDPSDAEIEMEIDLSFDQIAMGPEDDPDVPAETEVPDPDAVPEQPVQPDQAAQPDGPDQPAQPAAMDLGVLDSQPEMEDRVQELVSEADVFSKYGLQEKALDRLSEAAELDPASVAALTRLIDLLMTDDKRMQVVERAGQLHAATQGEGDDWSRIERQLVEAGYEVHGADISAPAVDSQTEYEDVSREEMPAETAAAMATLDVAEEPAQVEDVAVLEPGVVQDETTADDEQELVDGIDAAFDALAATSDGSEDISEGFAALEREHEADLEAQIVDDDLLGEGVMGSSELDVEDLREDLESFEADAPSPSPVDAQEPPDDTVPDAVAEVADQEEPDREEPDREEPVQQDQGLEEEVPVLEQDDLAAPELVAREAQVDDVHVIEELSEEAVSEPLEMVAEPAVDSAETVEPEEPVAEVPIAADSMVPPATDQAPATLDVQSHADSDSDDSSVVDVPEEAAASAESAEAEDSAESSTPSWLDQDPASDADGDADRDGDDLFDDEQSFFDLGAALRDELEEGAESAAEPAAESGADPGEQSLEQIVEGFKRGVSENIPQEDSDTHYNLGIAYREMMLLDEAISEFQISAKDPRYLVDSCAMLGLCFREKGLPDLAVNWYQRALDSEHLSGDQRLSMLYDLGLTYETMEDSGAAFNAFAEIYGNDTSFRDVAERVDRLRA